MKKHPWQTSYKVTNWSDYNRETSDREDLTDINQIVTSLATQPYIKSIPFPRKTQ